MTIKQTTALRRMANIQAEPPMPLTLKCVVRDILHAIDVVLVGCVVIASIYGSLDWLVPPTLFGAGRKYVLNAATLGLLLLAGNSWGHYLMRKRKGHPRPCGSAHARPRAS